MPTVDIFPHVHFVYFQRSAHSRGGQVTSSPSQRGDRPRVAPTCHEPRHDGNDVAPATRFANVVGYRWEGLAEQQISVAELVGAHESQTPCIVLLCRDTLG